ncbi:MAG TPA: hypothetical protein VJB09_01260 [Candidatus Paceibacterota bacterium]
MKKDETIEHSAFLIEITNGLLKLLRTTPNPFPKLFDKTTYEVYRDGFARITFKKKHLERWRDNPYFNLDLMSCEILWVESDLEHEIHRHENSHALITILGMREGFAEPNGTYFYLDDKNALPARSGLTIDVYPNRIHGFSAPNGGRITFLSIQSRKIIEDFHLV